MIDQMRSTQPRLTGAPDAYAGDRPEQGLSLLDLLRRVFSHTPLILSCGLSCLLLTLGYVKLRHPSYEASAVLRIDPGRAGTMGLSDLQAPTSPEPDEAIHTEMVVLHSDSVAIRALNALSSQDFGRFAGRPRGPAPIPEEVGKLSLDQQELINRLQRQLNVKQIDGTQLVAVSITDKDPQLAANLDNELIKAYTVQNYANRDRSVAQLRSWLATQMTELQDQVETAQRKLGEFEQFNHVVETTATSNSIGDRLHFLDERLAAAQAGRIEKEAQMHAAAAAGPSELANLFPNPRLGTLQSAQGTLYAQYAQLSTKFGARYPPLVDLRRQMEQIDGEIAQEVHSASARLHQEYEGAKRAQDLLQGEYDKQIQLAYGLSRHQAEYAVLQGDLNTSKELYDTLRRKLQQAAVDTQVGGLNTTLVQVARVPTQAAGPQKRLLLAGGLIVGLLAGIITAFVFEASSDHIQAVKQVEATIGYPVLATVSALPDVPGAVTAGAAPYGMVFPPSPFVLREPTSPYSEGIRSLRDATLVLPEVKLLLIGSGQEGEGSTSTAANLAVAIAQAGLRVLLIDTDLDNGGVHRELGIENGSGLSEYLDQATPKPKIVQPVSELEGLFVVTSGSANLVSTGALVSMNFHKLLKEWRRDFDYVLLSAAPLLTTSASLLLAHRADATIVVTCYGATRLSELRRVRDALHRSNAYVRGVVINDFPIPGERSRLFGRSAVGHA